MAEGSHESPGLVGVFPHAAAREPESACEPAGEFRSFGDWRPEELRIRDHHLGKLVIYGNCLADDATIDRCLNEALERNDPTRLTTLPGSYTTLLVRPDGLTALADLANQFPLFYRSDAGTTHLASLTAPLCVDNARDNIDPLTLASQIVAPRASDLMAGRSGFANIQRLEAGHTLDVDSQGKTSISRYEDLSVPSVTSIDEAAEKLRSAMIDAARLRAEWGRRTSSDFSGGYDSTSMAFLLAHQVDAPLLVTARHMQGNPTDDLEYVRKYLRLPASQGLFEPHEIEEGADLAVYSDLLSLPTGDQPDASVVGRAQQRAYFNFLREHGIELHITGNGADAILDMDPRQYLGGLARLRTLPRFLRSVLEVGRTENSSPRGLIKNIRGASRLNPGSSLVALSQLLATAEPTAEQKKYAGILFGEATAPRWLTPTMRKALADLALAQAESVEVDDGQDHGNYIAYSDVRGFGPLLHGAMQFAAGYGLRVHAPYMDNDILRACFSIPAHERVNPWIFKAILGKALHGLVPDEVTQRRTKGDYTRIGFQGLRQAAPALEHLLRDSRLADLGIIDPSRVRASLDRSYAGANPPWASIDGLVAAELWLRSLDSSSSLPSKNRAADAIVISPKEEEPADPLEATAQYGMPSDVIMAIRDNGAIVLNIATGTFYRLNLAASRVIQALSATNNFGEAITELSAHYPVIEESVLRSGSSDLIRQLLARNLLNETKDRGLFSIVETKDDVSKEIALPINMTRQGHEPIALRLRDRLMTMGGLAVSSAVRRLSFAKQVKLIDRLHRRWANKPDTVENAERTLAAAHRLTALSLGRAACLELSMATVMTAALRRRRIDLVLGTRADPDSFHSWPEVEGVPIRTHLDEPITGVYQRILKV